MKLKTLEQKVSHILQIYPETRNCDNKLLWRYNQTYNHNSCDFWDILQNVSIKGIFRVRRKIQANGMYESDKQMKKARELKTWEYNEYASEVLR